MEEGWEDGRLTAPVYEDAVRGLRAWSKGGVRVGVYSSGAATAQRALFGHVRGEGSLLKEVEGGGHWDTTSAGPKKDVSSYRTMAAALHPRRPLFLSDCPDEVHAALQAGWQAALVRRPGNRPLPDGWNEAPIVDDFDQVRKQFKLP